MEHYLPHSIQITCSRLRDGVLTVENVGNLWFSFVIVEIISFSFFFQVNSIETVYNSKNPIFQNNPTADFFRLLSYHFLPCPISPVPLFSIFLVAFPNLTALFFLLDLKRSWILKSLLFIQSSLCKSFMNVFSKKKTSAVMDYMLMDYRYNFSYTQWDCNCTFMKFIGWNGNSKFINKYIFQPVTLMTAYSCQSLC